MSLKTGTKVLFKNAVLGIDPGITGAFVLTDGIAIKTWAMPLVVVGKEKLVDFVGVRKLLAAISGEVGGPHLHVFLERAVPMAMGSKHAFNYGRSFQSIVLAIEIEQFPYTLVEPQKWAKEMHQGISADLKGKAKSLIAAKRLLPKLVGLLPTKPKGGVHDGMIDALLIAGYGLRTLVKTSYVPDFY